jgi:hypothetical protein
MGVLIAGNGVAVTGMAVGAADMVWVTMAWIVAIESTVFGFAGCSSGMAIRVTGKQAMIARAIMPKKIRIELVVSFILHLQVVLLMDGALNMKVPRLSRCYRTVTANRRKPVE